jgi:purine catabolism regulator
MSNVKENKIIQRLEHHLRQTSRKLIKIDTEEEAIQFLINSFKTELYCDFVGVILAETDEYIAKAWEGSIEKIQHIFPLEIENCSSLLLLQSIRNNDVILKENCNLTKMLIESGVKTWFTVPITDETQRYGFCIIGFFTYIPLLEMDDIFNEFGKDIAAAISMAKRNDYQFKKMEGIEWISKNLSINKSLDERISELTLNAAKATDAQSTCIYLFNEKENCFDLQYPVLGSKIYPGKVILNQENALKEYFPYLEQSGGRQISIPIVVGLKTIGVLQVEDKIKKVLFSEDDVYLLKILSDHIAILLKNAELYNTEKDHRERLQILLDYQQALVKETVAHDDFHGVTDMLGELFGGPVILYDRFIRPLSYNMEENEQEILEKLTLEAEKNRSTSEIFKVLDEGDTPFSIWPVNGGGILLGYLAVNINNDEIDEFDKLTVELARNICSIQFIKQKLVLDANEQAKDTFMSKVLVENIVDKQTVLQYANLFQLDIYQPHRVMILTIELDESEILGLNLLEQRAKQLIVWDRITDNILTKWSDILTVTFKEYYLFVVPVDEGKKQKQFWGKFYENIKEATLKSGLNCEVYLGIGSKVEDINDYNSSYEQSLQVLNVVKKRFKSKGYSLYEELGAYTILHHLNHPVVNMFIDSQLGALLLGGEEKNINLFQTLTVYLQNNGNGKDTSKELFIHRSTLLYRIEKIESLLGIDLHDSETRFNLMMAIKLYDMNR